MKRTKLLSTLFIVVALLTLCLSVSATGLEETYDLYFTVEASASTVSYGSNFQVILNIGENPGFKNAKLDLLYDASLVTFTGVDYTDTLFDSKNGTAKEIDGGLRLNLGTSADIFGSNIYSASGKALVLNFTVNETVTTETKVDFALEINPKNVVDANQQTGALKVSVNAISVNVGEVTPDIPDDPEEDDCAHDYEIIPAKNPTCTEKGNTQGVVCKMCGVYLVKPEEIALLPHTETTIDAIASTCKELGWTEGKMCSVCQTVLVAPQQLTEFGAHVEEIIPAVEGTCQDTGWTEGKKCSVCEAILLAPEETGLADHVWEITPGKEPTCTMPGLSDGKKCTLCGEEVAQTVIGNLGHDPIAVPGTAATCTTDGLTDGEKCSRCDLVLKAQETIQATGHTLSEIPAVAPTCDVAGSSAGEWCIVCEEVTVKPQEVAALGHDYVSVQVAPTCTTKGYTTHTCSRCEDTYTDSETDMIEHTPVIVEGIAPTCTTTGLSDGKKCAVCDAVLEEQKTLPLAEHVSQFVPGKHATCTEEGYTESSKCSVCGMTLVQPGILPATGHVEVDVIGFPATHEQSGLTDGKKCTVCGVFTVPQKVIAALKHTIEIIPGKAATCTETGLTEGQKCTGCCNGAILVEQEVIPALGHDYKAVVTAPTCATEGFTTYTCSRCNDSYTGDVAAKLPHTEITVAGTPATCTATGLTDGIKCGACGEELKAQEVIPVAEHSFGEWVIDREATATENGVKSRTCSVCAYMETETIPATGETTDPTEPVVPTEPTQPTEPGGQPTEPPATNTQPTQPNNGGDNSNTVLIIAVIALFVAAAAIIVLLILKKK